MLLAGGTSTFSRTDSRLCAQRNTYCDVWAAAALRAFAVRDSYRRCCSSRGPRPVCAVATTTQQLVSDAALFQDEEFAGLVEVREIEGKGRGLVTTADVSAGELLLCCHPLGVVTGPQQVRLSVDQLHMHLASNYNSRIHHWIQQLYDGSDKSVVTAVTLHHHQQHSQTSSSSSSSEGDTHRHSADVSGVPPVTDTVLQQLMDVVKYNAYGDLHDDLAAAAAAGEQAVALLGLWPEFSMLNHSCVPNAINWVLPGVNRAMLVRAARHIPAGEEVTISYLGAPQLLPLDGRREALSTAFGFDCSCPRCRAEEDIPGDMGELMQDIVSRVSQSFMPRLQRCLDSSGSCNTQQLKELRHQAAAMMTVLYQQLRKHLIHPAVRQQLLSSCFPCLEIIADIDMALGDHAAAASSLSKCLTAAAAVTPGSDLHVILASRFEGVQQQLYGQGSAEAALAWQMCVSAHRLRYGAGVDECTITRLAVLNRSLYV